MEGFDRGSGQEGRLHSSLARERAASESMALEARSRRALATVGCRDISRDRRLDVDSPHQRRVPFRRPQTRQGHLHHHRNHDAHEHHGVAPERPRARLAADARTGTERQRQPTSVRDRTARLRGWSRRVEAGEVPSRHGGFQPSGLGHRTRARWRHQDGVGDSSSRRPVASSGL